MTTPLIPQLPNPKYETWVRSGIDRLRKAGFTDQEIRNDFLVAQEGMADTTADRFLPIAPVTPVAPPQTPPRSPTVDYASKMVGGDAYGMLAQILGLEGPDALKNLGGVGATALRGVTLGASDYIPPVKKASAEYREAHPIAGAGVELTAGFALNPLRWIKAARGIIQTEPAKTGLKAALKAGGKAGVQGAGYGGIYGFNTAEGDLGDRLTSGFGGAMLGGALGAGLGTALSFPEAIGATRAMRKETGLSPKSASIIAKAWEEQGGRIPLQPGEILMEQAGPLERSVVHEALRRSGQGLAYASKLKSEWIASQKDAPLGLALEVAGIPPEQGRRFPNPVLLAQKLRADAKSIAQPLYARLSAENVSLPKTPELDAALESPTFREFLTSPAFRRFAADRAAADKVRGITGAPARGTLMSPDAIKAAIGEGPTPGGDLMEKMRATLGVTRSPDPSLVAAIQRSAAKFAGTSGEPPPFDWRTLHAAKLAIDESLRGSESAVGSLKRMARADLLATRGALMRTLKQAPGYDEALGKYAGGHVEAELLEAGQAAARKGADEVEALLLDPKTAEMGAGALNQARFGVLSELYSQLENATQNALVSGDVWTPARIRMLKLVAASPEQAANVDAFVQAQAKRWEAFSIVPKHVSGIQTRAPEQMEGAVAGVAAAGGLGSGLGFRIGNIAQRLLSKMSPAEAYDIVRTYFSPNPGKAMEAIMGAFPRDASRVGEFSGRAVGIGVGSLQP